MFLFFTICMQPFFSLFSPETSQDGTETSVLVYNNSCKKFGVTPRDGVLKHLLTDKLAINNGRLTRHDIQPLAYSLTVCFISGTNFIVNFTVWSLPKNGLIPLKNGQGNKSIVI